MLVVQNGLHSDAVMTFGTEPVIIGSGPDATMALLDDGIAAQHISIRQQSGNVYLLQALAPDVVVNTVPLPSGESTTITGPATLRLGPVSLHLGFDGTIAASPETFTSASENTISTKQKTIPTIMIIGGVTTILILVVIQALSHSATPAPRIASASPSHAPDLETASLQQPASDAELGHLVVQQLTQHHLPELKVSASSGVIIVDGSLSAQEMKTFRDVEKWFDASFGTQAVWVSNVSIAPVTAPVDVPIQAVWTGKNPNIVVHSQRYRVGTEIVTGLSLSEIRKHTVIMHKGLRPVNFKY
ncbi:EscD/YscD/HrpQ family type III secretion system periplasmic domain-containing protein [Gluconobacter wancherniae]|uniref:SctD/MshK family protein n=1 Tax=Gluconobacter wancherniae TaxID=1307955 RepID=UPI0030A40B06